MLSKFLNFFTATLIDLCASIRCLFYTLFVKTKQDLPVPGMEQKPDILCVHGYLHNETPWAPFRRYLQKRGAGPVNAVRYFSVVEEIPKNSLSIKAKIDDIKKKTGRPVDILIGHSQGGLVSLEYALEHAQKNRMTTVVLLGSPLHGTPFAKIGFGTSAKQMREGSEYLKSLHNRLKHAKHLRILALGSQADWMVPGHSALAAEYPFAKNVLFSNIGHVNFLFSKKVMEAVADFLFNESSHLIDRA